MIYTISFTLDGKESNENFEADNPAVAFAMCLALFPQCTLRKASVHHYNRALKGYFWQEFDPPKVQRPLPEKFRHQRLPARNDPDGTFPFYDECQGSGS
jgi:hypothetical protein